MKSQPTENLLKTKKWRQNFLAEKKWKQIAWEQKTFRLKKTVGLTLKSLQEQADIKKTDSNSLETKKFNKNFNKKFMATIWKKKSHGKQFYAINRISC